MSDIVDRLRAMAGCGLQGWHDPAICGELRKASDEIERLMRINEDHCRAVNTLTIENSRQCDEIERLHAEIGKWEQLAGKATLLMGRLEAENERLQAENEQLRGELREAGREIGELRYFGKIPL